MQVSAQFITIIEINYYILYINIIYNNNLLAFGVNDLVIDSPFAALSVLFYEF